MKSIEEQLKCLEEKLLTNEFRKSELKLDKIIADDFLEIGSSGKQYDKSTVISSLLNEEKINVLVSNFSVKKLSGNCFLVTYKANKISEKNIESIRSSIWKENEGCWQIVFHQGTLCK